MRAVHVVGILLLLVTAGIVSTYAPARAPVRDNSAVSATYRNDTLGFTIAYNPARISPGENFSVTPVARPWFCAPREKLAEEYLSSVPVPGEKCREAPFLEFVNFSAPRGVQTILQSAARTSVVILRSRIPLTNTATGATETRDSYRIFAEAPKGASAWALDFYLVPRKGILLCGDNTCDIGEEAPGNSSYCHADCPNGKDWTAILEDTFSTLKFIQ